MLGSLHMLDKAILKSYKNNEGKYVCSYQFIKVVESTDMYVVEKYLRHSVLSGSFLRLCSSLWVGIQIDVHVFDAKFLHFVLCSHTERTAGDGENNDSSFHGWFWRNKLNEYLVKNANLTIQPVDTRKWQESRGGLGAWYTVYILGAWVQEHDHEFLQGTWQRKTWKLHSSRGYLKESMSRVETISQVAICLQVLVCWPQCPP